MQAKFGPSNSSFFHLILTNCQLLRTATVTYTTNIITASTAHTSTSASNQVQENLPVDTDEKVPEQSPSNSSTLLSRESIVSSLLRLSCSRGRHSGFLLRLHTWPSIITSNTTMHSIWVAHCSEHTAVCLFGCQKHTLCKNGWANWEAICIWVAHCSERTAVCLFVCQKHTLSQLGSHLLCGHGHPEVYCFNNNPFNRSLLYYY